MIAPNRICRVASGAPSTLSSVVRTVRINAPTIVPAYPPRPPKIDVPPITTAATEGSRYGSTSRPVALPITPA